MCFWSVHFKTKIHNPSALYFLILGNKRLADVYVCCATCSISSNLKFKASFILESVRQKSVVAKFQKLLRALCIHKQLTPPRKLNEITKIHLIEKIEWFQYSDALFSMLCRNVPVCIWMYLDILGCAWIYTWMYLFHIDSPEFRQKGLKTNI